MEMKVFQIESIQDAGETILPAFELPFKAGKIIGIYAEPTKVNHLLNAFSKLDGVDVYFKEDQLYERLTIKQHFKFYKKLYESKETVESLLYMFGLEQYANKRTRDLDESEKRKLLFLKYYLSANNFLVLDEPFQNIDRQAKQLILNILSKLSNKMILILSNNLEDLFIATDQVHRLDKTGLRALDVNNEQKDHEEQSEFTEIRIDKIPTKKDDKIILFNPPEIDYIESIEGEVNVYVAGIAYPCSLTLTELEKRFAPLGFFRCHRSYIVNLKKVREIITWTRNSYSLVIDTTDKATVPLSRNNFPILKKMIGI